LPGARELDEFALRGLQFRAVEIEERLSGFYDRADDVDVEFFHASFGPRREETVAGVVVIDRAVDADGACERLA
jgi:hypothetical protein